MLFSGARASPTSFSFVVVGWAKWQARVLQHLSLDFSYVEKEAVYDAVEVPS